jgi:hypothetical protein
MTAVKNRITTIKKLLIVPGTANPQLIKIALGRGRQSMRSPRQQQPRRILLL